MSRKKNRGVVRRVPLKTPWRFVPRTHAAGRWTFPRGLVQSLKRGFAGGGAAGGSGQFASGGGPVLANAHIQLIFWGAYWATAAGGANAPAAADVVTAVGDIITNGYFVDLAQYGVNPPPVNAVNSVIVSQATGASPANPPNQFTDNDVSRLVQDLIAANRLPDPRTDNQLLFCVIMTPGTPGRIVDTAGNPLIGEHFAADILVAGANVTAPCAWITWHNGVLDDITEVLSHEMAEACTDPLMTGYQSQTMCGGGEVGVCEISDVCEGTTAPLAGHLVQAYWSNQAGRCVVGGVSEAPVGGGCLGLLIAIPAALILGIRNG